MRRGALTCWAGSRSTCPRQNVVGDVGDPLGVPVAEDAVGLGNHFEQVLAVALGHAPRHHDLGVFAGLPQLEEGVDGLLLGRLDERTGVHQDELGGLGRLGTGVALVLEGRDHVLGVDLVFEAAELLDVKGLGHGVRGSPD